MLYIITKQKIAIFLAGIEKPAGASHFIGFWVTHGKMGLNSLLRAW